MTNQEKGERLKKILEKLGKNPNDETCNADTHNLLLEDCGGKLYKYMPFRDYTISSIQNNTLHFSSPAVFNDPFDCKIGIDILSLYETKYQKELEKIDLYLNDFLALRDGLKSIEEIPKERLPIIDRWTSNKQLMGFLDTYADSTLSTEKVNELLLKNIDVVCEFLLPILKEASSSNMPIISALVSKMIKNASEDNLKQLINDVNYSEYLKIFGVNFDADEIDKTIKACEIIHPESQPQLDAAKKDLILWEQKLSDSLNSNFKICCLSTEYKNKLMWSHYADSHKGICVEYDFSSKAVNKSQPLPVYYSHTRPKFPWKAVIEESTEAKRQGQICFMQALLTKDKVWSYENEWRMVVQAKTEPDNVDAPPIKCIYIGALCSEENTKKIVNTAKALKIPVKRMTIDRGKYELHAVEI